MGDFRVTLFMVAVIAIYVMAPAVVLRWWRSRGTERLFNRVVDVLILLAAVVGIGCFIDGLREPYHPQVTHWTVQVAKMAPGTRVRIVHISDLHSEERPKLEEKLPDIIAAEHPDVIVFTGDAANSPSGLKVFRKMMSRLTEFAPVYAIRGNWDNPGILDGTNAVELKNRAEEVDIRGQKIEIAGEELFGMGVKKVMATLPPEVPSVVLMHSPDSVLDAPQASLILAGHTHGGQIRLPWYGALITLSKYGKKYEAGLYQEGASYLYVSRGIGMEPNAPVRFLCRPEVVVIDMVGK